MTNKSQSDLNTYAYSFSPVYAINKNLYWLELSIYYSLHRKGALLCNNVSLGGSFGNAEENNSAHKQPPRTKGQGCAPAAFPFQFNSSQVKYSGPFSSAISPLWGPSSITVMSYPYQNAPVPAACKRHWLLFNNYCNCGTAEINCTDGIRFFFFFTSLKIGRLLDVSQSPSVVNIKIRVHSAAESHQPFRMGKRKQP